MRTFKQTLLFGFCLLMILVLSSTSNAQQQQGPIDKYRVEFSVDQGSTWKERGFIVHDASNSRNRLQFRPTLTNDAKWSKDVIQIISDRILNKKKQTTENLIYQIRVINLNDENSQIVSSISMCDFINSKFKEVWHLHFDSKENLLSLNSVADTHISPTPFHSKSCSSDVIASLEKLKNGLQNGVRESVRITIHNPPKSAEKISFAGVKTPEDKKKEVEQANEPGFFRKYWYLLVPAVLILFGSMFTASE